MMAMLMSMSLLIPLIFVYNFWFFQFLIFLLSFYFMFYYFNYLFMNTITLIFGLDLLSYSLILLSFWVIVLMILASASFYSDKYFQMFFLFINLVLLLSLVLTFSSMNLFFFYLFFEISLIPTLILILGWGFNPERLEAGFYLLFYTLFMSLPMMIMIFYLYKCNGSLMFIFMSKQLDSIYMYLCINMVFFVKIPIFLLHLWLPKAHVEAPVAGSMILAGIMLKLGGYGLLRLLMMFSYCFLNFNLMVISISLIGGLMVSLICIQQSDMKSLIAYSSVAHMGLTLSGMLTLNFWGLWGSLLMMLAHGLCSSGLFCLVNLMYERTHSRSVYLNKGLLNLMPSLSLWWFLLLSSNMAAPFSLNLFGEIMLINSLVSFSNMNMMALMFLSFFSAVYSLFLYSYSQHGILYSGVFSYSVIMSREFLLLILHWIPLNLLFLKLDILIQWI